MLGATVRAAATLLAFILLFGAVLAQQPAATDKPKKDTDKPAKDAEKPAALGDLLERAMKDNPDVRVAEAKLREADAELNRVRMQITQKVVAWHRAQEAQKGLIESAERELKRMEKLMQAKAISAEELEPGKQKLLDAKAKLAELEAEIAYLSGKQPEQRFLGRVFFRNVDADTAAAGDLAVAVQIHFASDLVQGTVADKLRAALDKPITVQLEATALSEILKHLEDQTGVAIVLPNMGNFSVRVDLDLRQLPLTAVLEAIEDKCDVRFLVRGYGLLCVHNDFANAPPGALRVSDYLKQLRQAEAKKAAVVK